MITVVIPNSVGYIGPEAFSGCGGLRSVYFQGNAAFADSGIYDRGVFFGAADVTVYYLPGTTGWGVTYGDRPTAVWSSPVILSNSPSFGLGADGFGFLVSWAPNASVVVEAGSGLDSPVWTRLRTKTLTGGTVFFSDPQWTSYPNRFYRVTTR